MWQYQNTDELYHYGVLGMKWGMRKAYNKGQDYNYKSLGQKKYAKKLSKIDNKINKRKENGKKITYSQNRKQKNYSNKLDMYKKRDKNREDYVRSTSVGKSVVKTLVFGPFGAGNYNRFRASGHGRLLSAIGSSYVASTLGYPLTGLLSKSSENRAARTEMKIEKKLKESK